MSPFTGIVALSVCCICAVTQEAPHSRRILSLLGEVQFLMSLKRLNVPERKVADPALREVHPLGKLPVVAGRDAREGCRPLSLPRPLLLSNTVRLLWKRARSPNGTEMASDGQLSFETESWLRYRYYMH